MVTPTHLSVLPLWMREQAWPLGMFVAVLLLGSTAARWTASRRSRQLSRQRQGVDAISFADYLAEFGFDVVIAAATYRYLQEVQRVDFPILPSDKLEECLGLALEDIDQTLRELSLMLRRDYSPGLAGYPLTTVEDLIRFLQACPRLARRPRRTEAAASVAA